MTLEEFCTKCNKRDIPTNPMARIRTFARELAEGAVYELWKMHFNRYAVTAPNPDSDDTGGSEQSIQQYLVKRWGAIDNAPSLDLLLRLNYLERISNDGGVAITRDAFDLLSDVDALNIFISYKRSESSAFALLLHDRLQAAGFNPFVDMQLKAGINWQNQLKNQIRDSHYLIAILGKETLHSSELVKEVEWAIASKTPIIPIWHKGFEYRKKDWSFMLQDSVDAAFQEVHTIRVIEENPLMYDMAIRELLNRFGISG